MNRKKLISLFFLLLLLTASFPQFSTTPIEPEKALGEEETRSGLYYAVQSILVMLMITFAIIAISGYLVAQFFGSETRARITVWSTSLLSAVGVAALVIVMFSVFVPIFEGRGIPGGSITDLLEDLARITESALIFLIITLVFVSAAVYVLGQMFGAETRARSNVWSQVLLGSALVATVIYVLLFQVLMQFKSSLTLPPYLDAYRNIILLVVFIISSIILITFLAAKVFKVPEWEAYLNIELANLLNSFLLLIFIAGFFAVSTAVSISIVGESSPPMAAIRIVQGFTDSILEGVIDIYTIQACTSVLSTFHRRIGEAVFSPTFRVFPGIDTFVSMTNVLAVGFVMVYGSLSAQITLLNIIDAVMVPFFLPAGLVLRFFPPTREAGAFLIALSFGFQIVFPTAYVINGMALADIGLAEYEGTTLVPKAYESDTLLINGLCGLSYAYFSVPPILLRTVSFGIFRFEALAARLESVFSEGTVHSFSMSLFIPILKSLSAISLLALFAPAVSMILTVASINALTKFIVLKG